MFTPTAGNHVVALEELAEEAAKHGITDLAAALAAVSNDAVQAAPALSLDVSWKKSTQGLISAVFSIGCRAGRCGGAP
jgi:hypothetical protein